MQKGIPGHWQKAEPFLGGEQGCKKATISIPTSPPQPGAASAHGSLNVPPWGKNHINVQNKYIHAVQE